MCNILKVISIISIFLYLFIFTQSFLKNVKCRQINVIISEKEMNCILQINKCYLSLYMCVCSMEFEYLNEVPVLTLDVNDEFKHNKIKCADMIEKV